MLWTMHNKYFDILKFVLKKTKSRTVKEHALSIACNMHNDFELVKYLIEEEKTKVNNMNTLCVLQYWCEANNIEAVEYLLEKGADTCIRRRMYTSILDIPIENNNLELAKLLLKYGAVIGNETDYCIKEARKCGKAEAADYVSKAIA